MFEDIGPSAELRPYQSRVLDRLAETWRQGSRRAWVVLPPGTGKTLVGLEGARRLGRRFVVFAPNTAIQSQWAQSWREWGGTAGTSRTLDEPVTVLTYQSLAVFDPDAETDEEGHEQGLLGRLHANGKALIDALGESGPLTLVLDECHHLLDVWGKLLAEVLEQMPDTVVIGLTATPPASLTGDEAELVEHLFAEPIVGASVPAMVRQGYLAPFAELAWLTTPTSAEEDYIAGEATRFGELTTDLLAPHFASTGFLEWVDARLTELSVQASGGRTVSWEWLERREPELAAAALRLHYAGLLALPPGARLREEHRRAPTAEDWVALLDDYVKNCLMAGDEDAAAVAAIRRALPAVGYRLTKRGIRSSRSPVDRVLARSAAKTRGAVEIVAAEGDALGERLRCLVLCDHERATATLPSGLREVLDPQAGAARLMIEELVADHRTRALRPMLVTGSTVAAAEETARDFAEFVAATSSGTSTHAAPELSVEPNGDGQAFITGRWRSRDWVPYVTAFFEAGGCRVLVGTRGLLGEGWNACGINALIDLTTATTPTSVVQTRGRALRLDPDWPEKTANTWTVVCATDRHPKGAADWERFARKHSGYLVAAPDGEIVDGVAHVDASFSPYAPPEPETFHAVNARMLQRAEDRAAIRGAWRIGADYRDELVHTIRVHTARTTAHTEPDVGAPGSRPEPPAVLPARECAAPLPPPPEPAPLPHLPPPSAPSLWRRTVGPPIQRQGRRSWSGRLLAGYYRVASVPEALAYVLGNMLVILSFLVYGMLTEDWVWEIWPVLGMMLLCYGVIISARGHRAQAHDSRAAALMRQFDAWRRKHDTELRYYHHADPIAGFKAWFDQPLRQVMSTRRFQRHRTQTLQVMRAYEAWLAENRKRRRAHDAHVLDGLCGDPSVVRFACAVADALAACELSAQGSEAVTAHVEPDGSYRLALTGVDTATSQMFTTALDELLAAPALPRYLIDRYVIHERTGDQRIERAEQWRHGEAVADGIAYHAVPTVLGQNRGRVNEFERAWRTWISRGAAVFTSSPKGADLLTVHRGVDPFSATTALRLAWD